MNKRKKKKKENKVNWLAIKFLFCIVITLVLLITLKSNQDFKTNFYKYVFESNISFAKINEWYESKFGSSIPFKDLIKDTEPVFNEKLKYSEANLFKDGVRLSVGSSYLVPALENGIVIFIGEKEDYGKTVIVQQENGIDVWFSNLSEINISLYDYIKKGSLIGEVNDDLYLKFIKEGKALKYQDYI